ncbi:1-deoxy-D-xylulose-5-phosphate reductoisomerase [Actinokineospora guangxiensis]|uniref:1-deoxy-D-xylulose 5-phosphate reductoisomerase n=1 Tax=Actinokineospora guangxiensis TaxID=1490288 RepID=A0ABW0ET78_9PSEU
MTSQRSLLVLGSTGSVGTQALDVVADNPERFRVVGLAAGGGNPDLLARQAVEHKVAYVAVTSGELEIPGVTVFTGPEAVDRLIETAQADVVLNGITGSIGLPATLKALETGALLALANKESLIAGGPLVLAAAKPGQIVPVDSEHSAMAQALRGGRTDEVDRLILTASGGPFRGRTREQLAAVTAAEAMAHPTWAMGPVITINSATLVNKALELMEAHLLFDVPYDRIDVVVHPQSIVHSMVSFHDGSTLAQASPPDMRLPIALALAWPDRVPGAAKPCDWSTAATWTFEPVDDETFPAIRLARHAGTVGGCLPAVYNAANEEAVAAFRQNHATFTDIVDTVGKVLDAAHDWTTPPRDVTDVKAAEDWARARARTLLAQGGNRP